MINAQDAELPAAASADERVEEFAEFLEQIEDGGEDVPAADAPAEDDQDQPGEPDDLAIAPVWWDNDAKALFAQLPPELQQKVAVREAQRERAIQSATTAAAEARRNAVVEANAALADQQRSYADHLEAIVAHHAPQRPDPALLAEDPQAFFQLQALYEEEVAEHHALARHAQQAQAEAHQRDALLSQHQLAQDHAELGTRLGEDWTDISRRRALLTDLETVGATLGYSMEMIGGANATDILALKTAAEWKAKADRYDAIQGNRMTAVKAARNAPRSSKPGVSPTRAEQTARGRDAAWARAKTERSGDAYAALLDGMGITL